jgi:hypothetical protein
MLRRLVSLQNPFARLRKLGWRKMITLTVILAAVATIVVVAIVTVYGIPVQELLSAHPESL